jgi:hypothetical protein
MRRNRLIVSALCAALPVPYCNAQTSNPSNLQSLRELVSVQDRQITTQQKEIEELRASIEEEKQMLRQAMGSVPAPAKAVAAAAAPQPATPQPTAPPPASSVPLTKPGHSVVGLPLNASQEVRFSDTSPTLKLGPANIRLEGYVALAGLFDSANVGGSIGTNFAAIPYSNTPEGNATEFRLSTQRTRVAVRVDTKMEKADLASYLEADFRGTTSGTVAVTSSSFGFRVRQAWLDYRRSRFEAAAGQMFSLITPVRSEVTPIPSEAMMTYAVDAQYVAGLVWDRAPGVRFTYFPSKSTTLAVALENPEQQVGTVVRFPTNLASVLGTQYNTGTAELRTPNLAPDIIIKGSYNRGGIGHRFHVDSALLLRSFRSYDPANISQHKQALGIGGNLNFGIDLTPRLHLVLNGFLSSGGGRYIGGLAPDVIVRANGDISPVKAHSWIGGLEFAPDRKNMLFGYYSGVYIARNTTIDRNGALVGFGYPGSNAGRRTIQEGTIGWGRLLWNSESAGSIQFNSQYSYIKNHPWSAADGPSSSQAHLVFGQIRYNLP